MNKFNWFIYYMDRGPSGPCPQVMSTTSPWQRLYRFYGTKEELDNVLKKLVSPGRARPRVTVFVDGEEDTIYENVRNL